MQLESKNRVFGLKRTDKWLLASILVLPALIACDGGTRVTTGSSADANDSVVEVVGDTADGDTTVDNTTASGALCIDSAPIGDGWGWDGSDSCRVDGSGATVEVADTTGSDVVCIDTAPLGDGWGWDGSDSCRVDGSQTTADTVPPAGSDTNQSDNNTDSQVGNPTFTEEELTQLAIGGLSDLVLVTGQSNALGAGTSYDEFLDSTDSEVLAYTNSGWQIADLNQVWDRNWFPRNDPSTPPSNNFSLHFGKRVASRSDGRVVGFILLTSPGSAISDWGPNSALFNSIRDKVSAAINEIPNKSRLDAILWHQGESDGEDRDEYSAALYDLIARFRSEPWFDDGRPFICGETAASPVNNQLNRLNTDADPWTACVEAEGLAVLPGTDHFNASSLRTIGQRYGDAYLEMWLGIQ